jgi:hypothetical protein
MRNSRYRDSEIKEHLAEDGRTVRYLARRFVPQPFGTTRPERAHEGERLDNMAARLLGDPTLYWQLCDAALVLSPSELERPADAERSTAHPSRRSGR